MLSHQGLSPRLSRTGIVLISGFAAIALCSPSVGQSQQVDKETTPAQLPSDPTPSESTNNALDLPTVADTFRGHVKVSGNLVSGNGIVRRIDGNEIHFRSGDYITTDESTIVIARVAKKPRFLKADVIRTGMAISFSMSLNQGSASPQRIVLIGELKTVPRPEIALELVKTLKLEKLGGTSTSLDGRFPIQIDGKTGVVTVKMGESTLIELAQPTMSVQWRHGNYRPEGVEDFEAFDYLLIEWLDNGHFRATCYRTPKK